MSKRKVLGLFIILGSLVCAIPMLDPFQKEIANNEIVYLGEIGPGQTLSLSLDGRPTTGGVFGKGGAYETANAIELPHGWTAQASDYAGIPLQVKISSEKYAPEGEYTIKIKVSDEDDKEKLGNITFFVKINITHDVIDVEVDKTKKEALTNQPVRFYITLRNKVNAGDVFSISSFNIPKWAFKKYVYVPPMSSKTLYYEVISKEEEEYNPIISITSESSPMISKTLNTSINVHSTALGDLKATNNGLLFFPVLGGIIYALAGLFSNFF